jgi:two-component system phosphate regulon sensor histidine kinase PhoR
MDEEGEVATVAQRVMALRWPLGLATLFIAGVAAWAGIGPAILAAAAVLCVAALAPLRGGRQRSARGDAEATATALRGITAEDLAAAVSDPLVTFDAAGVVAHLNGAAAVAFPGLSVGMSLSLRFRAPEMQGLIAAALARPQPLTIDYAEKVPVERFFRVSVSPVGDRRRLHVMIFKDQSETRRIDRMRADFIANASHELRTPLASIAGFVETLRGPARNDAAAREQFLQIMQAQTARMARLIDDLLSLSRLEMKPYLDPGSRVDLKPLIESVLDTLRPLAQDSGVVIHCDFGTGSTTVGGNGDELIQVFENLLENACKYGQAGGRVDVLLRQGGQLGGLEVTVRDYGPGIPEEHIPRLTERFYRVDVETSRGQKGTGLGLAIVKHILTRHRARLTIASPPGEGSSFTVHFPPTGP